MTKAGASRAANRPVPWPALRSGLLALVFFCGAMPLLAAGSSTRVGATDRPFRLAFSSRMFTEVKVEDARAAMKVWLITIMRERSVPVDPELKIYDSFEEMLRASKDSQIEGFGITTEEYWRLSKEIKFDRLIVAINNGRMTDEYVILVHRSSSIESIADLRGRGLIVLEHPRMSLAMVWLDTFLLQKGMNFSAKFFNRVMVVNKLSQAVLPVFFRKSDACLVTRRGYETMSELNPQVDKQLRVLAVSPEVVPSLFAFRADHISSAREQMVAEMGKLPDSPAGQQILTLLQTDRIEERPMSSLEDTLELLSTYHQLCSVAGGAKGKAAAPR